MFLLQITDTKGHTALNRENVDKGKFAVTSDEDDIFDFCFVSYLITGHSMPQPREVLIEMKHGVETKNYDQVADYIVLLIFNIVSIISLEQWQNSNH